MEHSTRIIPGIITNRYRELAQPQKEGDMSQQITGIQLKTIFPTLSQPYANMVANAINKAAPKYKMDSYDVMEEFIPTCGEESRNFTVFSENMNYRAPRMMEIFKSKIKTLEQARKYERKPEALANYVYADNKELGNGSVESGDGWRNRGGGAIQITGKYMWEAYAKYIGKPVSEVYDLVRNDLDWAIDSACWVFAVAKGLIDEAQADKFDTVTRRINPAMVNMDNRRTLYERTKKVLSASK